MQFYRVLVVLPGYLRQAERNREWTHAFLCGDQTDECTWICFCF